MAAPAGRTMSGSPAASRPAVPWRKVGPGWALATYSASQAGVGQTTKAGPSTLYLVDPQGGRYTLVTWSARNPRARWSLIGWSGDVSRALFSSGDSGPRQHVYQLQLQTGRVTRFTLPADVTAISYTRPGGLSILAEKGDPSKGSVTLQRYSLTGKLQKSLATDNGLGLLSGRAGVSVPYNSTGTELAAGTVNGLELISSAGGVIRMLPVPGVTEGCTAVRWWSSATVLASCSGTTETETGPRMWLVPASGATPAALTSARTVQGVGQTGFDFGDFNAWKLASGLYVDGHGGLADCASLVVGRQPAHGKEQQVNVPGSGINLILNATRSTLMVERITYQVVSECLPGTSLVWFNPATRKMTVAIPVSHHQLGVTAVVPYYIAGKF